MRKRRKKFSKGEIQKPKIKYVAFQYPHSIHSSSQESKENENKLEINKRNRNGDELTQKPPYK